MELIRIKKENEKEVVSARELYKNLELSKRFSNWIEKYIKIDNPYGFIENEDYTPYLEVHPQNNQEVQDYLLTLDMAKELCMLSKSEKGIAIRKYFIDCEKRYIENLKIQIDKKSPSILEGFKELSYEDHMILLESILHNLKVKLVREKYIIEEKIKKIDATGLSKPMRTELSGNKIIISQEL